jgi:hypothetical protein
VYIQLFVTQYVASEMLFVDFIWFPEQAPIPLGKTDVMCLPQERAAILHISLNTFCYNKRNYK